MIRLEGESYEVFRKRRREQNIADKMYLMGTVVWSMYVETPYGVNGVPYVKALHGPIGHGKKEAQ